MSKRKKAISPQPPLLVAHIGEIESPPKNGNGQKGALVNVEEFLAEINARLVSIDTASPPKPALTASEQIERTQVMTFELDRDRYAIDLKHAVEIIRYPRITPIPGLPEWVLGVTNLHGEILSVVDLGRFMNLAERGAGEADTLIIVLAADQKIGLAVDSVGLIFSFPLDMLVSPPFEVPDEHVAYLRGVVDHQQEFVRVLDCERLLLGQQMQQFG
jgi:purine-binding chemotaxis protein CheW